MRIILTSSKLSRSNPNQRKTQASHQIRILTMLDEVFLSHARLCDISTVLLERDLWCRTEVEAAARTCRRLICVVQEMKEYMVMHIMVI